MSFIKNMNISVNNPVSFDKGNHKKIEYNQDSTCAFNEHLAVSNGKTSINKNIILNVFLLKKKLQ